MLKNSGQDMYIQKTQLSYPCLQPPADTQEKTNWHLAWWGPIQILSLKKMDL